MNPTIKGAIKSILMLWFCLGLLTITAYCCVNYGLVNTVSRDYLEDMRDMK